MDVTPTEIRRTDEGLCLTWSDGAAATISCQKLRNECPCAECLMKRGDDSHAKPLTTRKKLLAVVEHTKEESLALKSIWGVGQYAIGIQWGDGHNSGIYTFTFLRELAFKG